MWSAIGFVFGSVLLVGLSFWLLLLMAMRTKSQPMLRAIRLLNKAFWNKRAMRRAGRPGAYAGVVRHLGRRSGLAYETPVGVISTDDGFVIALPYGTSPDWLKNVVAAGVAEIVHEGVSHRVSEPEVVGGSVVAYHLSRKERRVNRLYGVDEFLVLRRAS